MKRTLRQFLKLSCSRPNMDNAELHFRRLREGVPLITKQDLLLRMPSDTKFSDGQFSATKAPPISAAND